MARRRRSKARTISWKGLLGVRDKPSGRPVNKPTPSSRPKIKTPPQKKRPSSRPKITKQSQKKSIKVVKTSSSKYRLPSKVKTLRDNIVEKKPVHSKVPNPRVDYLHNYVSSEGTLDDIPHLPYSEENEENINQVSTTNAILGPVGGAINVDADWKKSSPDTTETPDDSQEDDKSDITSKLDWGATLAASVPYVAIGLKLASGILQGKAIKEQAKADANHYRRLGQQALEKAKRESKDVEVEHRFEDAANREKLKQSHLYSGQESFAAGTGLDSVLTANKNAAQELMADIMTEGRKQKQYYDQAADAALKAGKERGKFNILKTATGVATSVVGVAGAGK